MIPLRGWFIRAARSCTGCVVRYEFFTRYSDLSCCEYDKRTPSKNDMTLSRGIHGVGAGEPTRGVHTELVEAA